MEYRILIDLDAVAFLDSLRKDRRAQLLRHFSNLQQTPDAYSDYIEFDVTGRRVEINIFAGVAIHYWIDFPDRHIKILALKKAD